MEKFDYASIAKNAQEAVEVIKDPELKKIAFEKILDKLLGQDSSDKIESKKNASKIIKMKNGSNNKVKASRGGPSSQIKSLVEEGFFKTPKGIAALKEEFAARGFHLALADLATPLRRLCQQKILRRSKGADGNGYSYSNW